ncbi:MAG: site-specific integrase [Planctomycetaceae bacterium]|nr:site-specific integrase [Planctomycetaceae bacterium]
MEYAPDAEWRLIIALWRFGGLRRFSEVLRLKWEHILWDQGKIIVPSSKTERHGKAMRVIPIFHELSEPLRDCFEQAVPGDVYIIEKHCPPGVKKSIERKNMDSVTPLVEMFDKIVTRAGLDPWPMPGHNLRASLVTDLYNGKYPDIGVHTIAAWLGHSPKVALKYYSRVKESDFEKARVDPNGIEENTKKRNKNKVARKAHHDLPEMGGKDKKTGKRIKNTT